MIRQALILLVLLAGTLPAGAATLKGNVEVDEQVRLSDLFDGVAQDAVVSSAPTPGRPITFSAPQLLRLAQTYALDWRPAGGERIQVSRRETMVPVPVLTRRVEAGEILQASDVTVRELSSRRVLRTTVTSVDQIVGRSIKRGMAPEMAIQSIDLIAPLVVRRGDKVAMILSGGGIVLSAEGVAMQDGSVGQRINVTNVSSKKIIQVQVTGSGTVSVDAPHRAVPVTITADAPVARPAIAANAAGKTGTAVASAGPQQQETAP